MSRRQRVASAVCLTVLVLLRPSLPGMAATASQPTTDRVRALLAAGEYAKAEADAAVLVAEARAGGADVLDAQDLLVDALVLNGRGGTPEARATAEAVVLAREARGADAHLAQSLANLGDVLLDSGDYRAAIAPYQRAVRIRDRLTGRSPDLAGDLAALARALVFVERHVEARETATLAVALMEAAVPATDPRLATVLEVQGLVLQRGGLYQAVVPLLQRALSIREAASPNHPALAETLGLLGEQFWFNYDAAQSDLFARRALGHAERTLRPGHPEIATQLRRLALPLIEFGDAAEARRQRERGVAVAEAALGPDHPALALQLNDLSLSLSTEGDYAGARALLDRGRAIYERRLGPDYSGVTAAVFNSAAISFAIGDFLEARRGYELAIRTWTRVLGPTHPTVKMAQSAFGDMLEQQGAHAEAERLYHGVLKVTEAQDARGEIALTLTRLANSLSERGAHRDALAATTRAVAIWEQLPSKNSRLAGISFLMHGTVQERIGDNAAARKSFVRALDILQKNEAPPQDISVLQVALAGVLARTGDHAAAVRLALDAERASREHLLLTTRYLPERQALSLAGKRSKGLDVALALGPQSPELAAEIFDRVIRSRAIVLDEMARRNHRGAFAIGDEAAATYAALTQARTRLANLAVRGQGASSRDQYRARIDSLRREKEQSETRLAAASAAFRADLTAPTIGLADVRRRLSAGDAMVSIVRYDAGSSTPGLFDSPQPTARHPKYIAFVIQGSADPLMVSLGDAATLDAVVARWRSELETGLTRTPGSPQTAERALRRVGVELRQRIWDPVAPYLGSEPGRRVFIVPDGALNLVPFAALPADQGTYLIERGPTIHYLSAERDLAADPAAHTRGSGLLALGGASFGERPAAPAALAGPQPAGPAPFRGTGPDCDRFSSVRFEGLPGSQKEAAEIVALWDKFAPGGPAGGRAVEVLAGAGADERSVKILSPGRRVLHLATHGYFLGTSCGSAPSDTRAIGGLTTAGRPSARTTSRPREGMENPLLFSGLVLAGANQRSRVGPDDDDGILTAEEVASLNLDGVEWAVLSACDTGLGEIRAGEGVLGLRRAFKVAGARTVVMSLWSVQDRAATTWMRALYEGRLRRNLDTADAVREASLSVLAARRAAKQSTHPFFWAGFVASGDWR